MRKPSTTTLSVGCLFIVSIAGLLVFRNEESTYSLSHSIFLALFVSSIFYVATAYLPELQRRARIRKGLQKQYLSFRLKCIDLFLIASKSQEYRYRDNLLDAQEFRRYFSVVHSNGQTRWDLVATSIDDQDYIFEELVRELDLLNREFDVARLSLELYDEKVEDFFVSMNHVVHIIKASHPVSDDYKYFCRTLWSIFTRWNHSDGQLEYDIIEAMIERI